LPALRYDFSMTDTTTTELTKLPVAERLRLIEELWDSLDAEIDALPIPDWHRAELDKRLDALDNGTSVGAPWDEVRKRIKNTG
jgi:putative addiction module component (TIGR02574 family)